MSECHCGSSSSENYKDIHIDLFIYCTDLLCLSNLKKMFRPWQLICFTALQWPQNVFTHNYTGRRWTVCASGEGLFWSRQKATNLQRLTWYNHSLSIPLSVLHRCMCTCLIAPICLKLVLAFVPSSSLIPCLWPNPNVHPQDWDELRPCRLQYSEVFTVITPSLRGRETAELLKDSPRL